MNLVAATERHCVACQDVVVDFTQMSDAEVVAFLARRPDVTCGRFTETQLGRPLRGLPEPAPRWRTWLATTAALLGLREAAAQTAQAQKAASEVAEIPRPGNSSPNCATDELAQLEAQSSASAAALPTDSITLRGTVLAWWGLPLPNARVRFRGHTVHTNAFGHFTLVVPSLVEGYRMSVFSAGHDSKRIELNHVSHRYFVRLPKKSRFVGGKFR